MSQFTCEICGQGFDQKSRFDRHMETSHPKPAPSAADVERALSGIQYPKTKEGIVDYASQRITPSDKELFGLIQSLPSRSYRDSAEVAIAIGELKGRKVRTAEEAARAEQPSVRGGRAAATESVSAAAIAKALSGVDFPKRKEELRQYAQRHAPEAAIEEPEAVLNVIDRLPDREYKDMADVEKSVGQVL
jgi:hypothetical protein